MSGLLPRARNLLEGLGWPGADPTDGVHSTQGFSDGARYGIEVAGVQDGRELAALVEAASRAGVPLPDRVIETRGADGLGPHELAELVRVAADHQVGLVVSIGPRASRGRGGFARTPQGGRLGLRLRGTDQLAQGLADALRSLDAGVRGLLVYDEGLLEVLAGLRRAGKLPAGVQLKASIALGCSNPVRARQLELLGADSVNPVNDLDPAMLAGLRAAVRIPLDVHVDDAPDAGGIDRTWEVAALVGAAAPVFLKCGGGARVPGPAGLVARLARLGEALHSEVPGATRLARIAPEAALPVRG